MDAAPESRNPQSPDEAAPAVDRARFFTLFSAVLLPMFLAAVDQTLLATAASAIGHEFGQLDEMSWLATSYLLASLVMVPLYGQMGDMLGRRRMLRSAIGVFALGSLACGLAPGFGTLLAARVLQGLGGGGLMSLSQALIGEVLAPRQRARFQAWFAIVFVSASVLGPVVGGVVVHHASWRWLFLVNLPLSAFAAWRLSAVSGDDVRHPRRGGTDGIGAVLFAVAIAGTVWLLSEGGHRFAWTSPAVAWTAAGLVLVWAALVLAQRRRLASGRAPFLPLDLLAEPSVRSSLAVVFGFAAVMFATIFYLPACMQLALGSSAAESGLLLLPLTGGMILGSGLSGRLMVWTGRTRDWPILGMTLTALCLAGLGTLAFTQAHVIGLGFGAGCGLGMVMSVAQIITQSAAGPARLGAAAASVSLARSLGASVGAAVFGAIVFGHAGAASVSGIAAGPDLARSFHIAFLCAAGLAALTAVAALRLPRLLLNDDMPLPAAE